MRSLFAGRYVRAARGIQLCVARDVVEAMDAEVRVHPHIEVGGKYVGFVEAPRGQPRFEDGDLGGMAIRVVASLDSGPRAVRTATYHLPDGPYQAALFEYLLGFDPALEHLGTWHSHHPNGLAHLSSGDIRGNSLDVNDRRYNLDVFVASLVVDQRGFRTARHFVFLRGVWEYFEISRNDVRIDEAPNPWPVYLAQARRAVREGRARPPAWYETQRGQERIRFDRERLAALLGDIKLVRRDEFIGWRGSRDGATVYYWYGSEGLPCLLSMRSANGREVRIPLGGDARPVEDRFDTARGALDMLEQGDSRRPHAVAGFPFFLATELLAGPRPALPPPRSGTGRWDPNAAEPPGVPAERAAAAAPPVEREVPAHTVPLPPTPDAPRATNEEVARELVAVASTHPSGVRPAGRALHGDPAEPAPPRDSSRAAGPEATPTGSAPAAVPIANSAAPALGRAGVDAPKRAP